MVVIKSGAMAKGVFLFLRLHSKALLQIALSKKITSRLIDGGEKMNTKISIDVPALVAEYQKLQNDYGKLQNSFKKLQNDFNYEKQLRMDAERELLLLEEKIGKNYQKKRTVEERKKEAQERAERKLRGTTKDGRPLAKAAEWIESYDQFEAIRKWLFEKSAKNSDKRARNRFAWSLGCALGLRCGDLIKLKWGHLINKDGSFKEQIEIVEQKTSKSPSILITEAVKVFTKEYIETTGIVPILSEEIFKTQKTGGKVSSIRTTYSNLFKSAAQACGITKQISSHAMRHSFVTIICCLAGEQENLKSFQKGMYIASRAVGHSSEKITQRYSGMDEYIKKLGRQIVSDFLLGKSERVLKVPFDINTGDYTIEFKSDFETVNKCLNNAI